MSHCRHHINITIKDMITMSPVFICDRCASYVEPVKPWRWLRNLLNVIAILAVVYIAFAQLEGTIGALLLMVGLLVAVFVAYLILTWLILTLAPMVQARPDVNPEIQELWEEQEEAEQQNSEADYEEDTLPLPIKRVSESAFYNEDEEAALASEAYEAAEAQAQRIQQEVAAEARRAKKLWGGGQSKAASSALDTDTGEVPVIRNLLKTRNESQHEAENGTDGAKSQVKTKDEDQNTAYGPHKTGE